MTTQTGRYERFYERWFALRLAFRFDVRYRCRRLAELLPRLGLDLERRRVLDFGFGNGALLASLPRSCQVVGVDVSRSAVERARADPRFGRFAQATFVQVPEDDLSALPAGPFDAIVTSHALEHVLDDRAVLLALRQRLTADGLLIVFVPLEEPGYIRFHVHAYSMERITDRVRQAGFEILHREGSLHVNGHVWKLLTIPSRHGWPVVGPAGDGLRLASLSLPGYRGIRLLDRVLEALGFGARQALVIARPVSG